MRRLRVADRATWPRTSVAITCQRCRPSVIGRRRRQRGRLRRAGRLAVEQHLVGRCCPRGRAPSDQASVRQARAAPVRGRRPGRRARAAVVDGDRRAGGRSSDALHEGDRRVAGAVASRRRGRPRGVGRAERRVGQPAVAAERRRRRQREVVLEQPRADLGGRAEASAPRARRRRRRSSRANAASGLPGTPPARAEPTRRASRASSRIDRGERRAAGRLDDGDARAAPVDADARARRRCRSRALPSIAAGSSKAEPRRRRATARTVVPPGAVVDRLAEHDPGVARVVLDRRCRACRPSRRAPVEGRRASRRR